MEKEIAERFFENVTWFNKFFSDLEILYDKIYDALEKEFECEGDYYYSKSNARPSIPKIYFLYMGGEGKLGIQIGTIIDKSVVTNVDIAIDEPSMIVLVHDYKNFGSTGIIETVLKGSNFKSFKIQDGIISGIIPWDSDIAFDAFIVSLDAFMEYKDETVDDKIVSVLKELFRRRGR